MATVTNGHTNGHAQLTESQAALVRQYVGEELLKIAAAQRIQQVAAPLAARAVTSLESTIDRIMRRLVGEN